MRSNTLFFVVERLNTSYHQNNVISYFSRNLDKDIEGSQKRWKKFIEGECPERDKFPQDWKNKTALQRLCMMRSMRPDRMTYAVR